MSVNVLVVDGDKLHDWVKLFSGVQLSDGATVRVVQASWINLSVVTDRQGCLVTAAPVRETNGSERPATVTFRPDFCLIRNQPRGPTPATDRRNNLYGLVMGCVPSINSLESIMLNLERPAMVGALEAIRRRCGTEAFPLNEITYYSRPADMVVFDSFPAVLKVSHAHAGMGKVLCRDYQNFRDLSTVLALNQSYCTAEKYIDTDYGIRVQKIGPTYRVYRKHHTGSSWKSQFGGAGLEEIPLTAKYKLWADEAAKCFGGMELLAVDAVHGKDGKDYIIELNGTAIGIQTHHWKEDSEVIVNMVQMKLEQLRNGSASSDPHDVSAAREAAIESTEAWLQLRETQRKDAINRDKLEAETRARQATQGSAPAIDMKSAVVGCLLAVFVMIVREFLLR